MLAQCFFSRITWSTESLEAPEAGLSLLSRRLVQTGNPRQHEQLSSHLKGNLCGRIFTIATD